MRRIIIPTLAALLAAVLTAGIAMEGLKVLVNPRSREVFAYQPQIVPANRTAVPAP